MLMGLLSQHAAPTVGLRLPVQHQSRNHHQNQQNAEESTDDVAGVKSFPWEEQRGARWGPGMLF